MFVYLLFKKNISWQPGHVSHRSGASFVAETLDISKNQLDYAEPSHVPMLVGILKEWESQGSVEVQVSGQCLDSADMTGTGLHRIRVSISASTGANLLFRLRPTHICVHSRLQFSLSSVSLLPEGQSSVTLTSHVTRRDCLFHCFLNFFQAQHELWTIILTRWEPVELTREGP